jgi:hypothetical protein
MAVVAAGPSFVVLTAVMLLLAVMVRRAASAPEREEPLDPGALVELVAAGRIDEAELQLRERVASGSGPSWLDRAQLAELLVLRGGYGEAAALLQIPEEDPRWRAVAAFVEAEVFVLGRRNLPDDPDEVLRRRDAAVVHVPAGARPGYVAAWEALRGACLVRQGREDLAVDLLVQGLRASLAQTPTRAVYLFHLARALHRQGRAAAARARYEEVCSVAPGTPWADGAVLHLARLADGGD